MVYSFFYFYCCDIVFSIGLRQTSITELPNPHPTSLNCERIFKHKKKNILSFPLFSTVLISFWQERKKKKKCVLTYRYKEKESNAMKK